MSDQVTEPVDVFSMSDEEFANLNLSEINAESTSVDSSVDGAEVQVENTESVEEVQDEQIQEEELESVEDIDGDTDGTVGLEELSEEEPIQEEPEVVEDSFDYEAEYKKLIGSPIKANGREITIENIEEAQRLIQMGINYSSKMESLKPARQVIAMLEEHNMMDTEKLSFAIDLINKNPQAINKLIADQDLTEIMDDEKQYTPSNYSVDEKQLNVTEALDAIKHTESYSRTVNVLANQWDAQSRDIITNNPEVISIINEQVADGSFDKVIAEVDRRKLFGSIPVGTPDIVAYKMVGDEMYASKNSSPAQVDALKANAPKPPIRKPKAVVEQQKRSTSVPRGKAPVTQQFEDVFNMSDDDFNKKYGF